MDFSRMSEREILALRKSEKVVPSKGKKGKRKRMPTKNRTEWGWKFPDGREICDTKSPAGRTEYHMRTYDMSTRQGWVCGCGCGRGMVEMWGVPWSMTFEHENLRGGGKQDDRIVDENGNEMNKAFRYDCNMAKGSKREHGLKSGRAGSGE